MIRSLNVSINRNILECKVVNDADVITCELCINRNILECKEEWTDRNILTFLVLIETYWNVKLISTQVFPMILNGINRNILECKVIRICDAFWQDIVLIETYWNVKAGISTFSVVRRTVLIETYWNVKWGHRGRQGLSDGY